VKGRPKTPDHLQTIAVTVRLRRELLWRLQARADIYGMSRNQVIIQILSNATTPQYLNPSDSGATA
jgi:hypothetical protein